MNRWMELVQEHNAVTLGWIRALEPSPQLHAHVAILAARSIDNRHASLQWMQVTGARSKTAAVVEPYRFGICGLGYIMKSLDSHYEDVAYSSNLLAFVPDAERRHFGRNAAERRQIRRIERQALSRKLDKSDARLTRVDNFLA